MTHSWSDKLIFHGGARQTHVDIVLTTQRLRPYIADVVQK